MRFTQPRLAWIALLALCSAALLTACADRMPVMQTTATPATRNTTLAATASPAPMATSPTATATATPRPLTLPPKPTRSPASTIDPVQPTATPCRAEWCQVLGVQDEMQWSTVEPVKLSGLGYGMQLHGCGAGSKSQAISLVTDAGFDWVKQQVRWNEIEGVKGAYAWKCVDDVVERARRAGLKVLLSLNTAPAWAHTASGAPNTAAFANFAAQVAQRYRGRIAAIEVFNEPNLAIEWGPKIDPAGYARLLAAAHQHIKAVDPSLIVISAGLAPTRWNDWGAAVDDLKYLRAIADTIATSADCVGVHFNDGRASPLAPDSTFQQIVNDYRKITNMPLCLTEFGIAAPVDGQTPPTDFEWSANTTESDMAHWLAEGFLWAQRNPDVIPLIIVWNLNYYQDLSDPSSLYALQTPDGLRKAYLALKALRK